MKGLFLKDTLIFSNYKRNIIFTIIIFIILIFLASIERNMLTYGTLLFMLMFGMNSISTFSYDEATNTDEYLLSIGITRKEIVISKYLMAIFTLLSSMVLGFIVSLIASMVIRVSLDGIVDSLKTILLVFTGISFLMCSDIPCIYKWGVEKGRMQAVIVPVILLFVAGLIMLVLFTINPNLYISLSDFKIENYMFYILILVNVIMYMISYLISYRLFKNKDM